jgi:peptide/nickel transport system ATP-binding protein
MVDLQRELGLTYVFIAHDLKIIEYISTRVAVMYLGKIVELARAEEIYRSPKHPYTQALLSAIPVPDPTRKSERIILAGDVPSPAHPPPGCPFHPRCRYAFDRCRTEVPPLYQLAGGHLASCFLVEEQAGHNPQPSTRSAI